MTNADHIDLTAASPPLSRTEWVQKITERYHDSVRAIVEVGRYLIQAKAALPHGEFGCMIGEDLPFGRHTAFRLMAIAQNPILANDTHGQHLPASWRTLYELSKLPTPTLERALTSGQITPDLQRKQIRSLRLDNGVYAPSPRSDAFNLYDLVRDGQTFGTIYIDPPWPYENQATRAATDNHYRTMTLEEIAALPVGQLAAGSTHLHLWTTNAFLFACKSLFAAWGFEYKGVFVWIKPGFGIGNYWRVAHEFLLLGARGNVPFRDQRHRSWLFAERREHSEKPDTVRELIEEVSPGPYLELFGRKRVQGWTVWGDEIEETS